MILKKHPKKFFSPEEQRQIVHEIIQAEKKTTAEIRVHLDRHAGKDVMKKAEEIFFRLGMNQTKHRNGILIYLATDQRKFAVLGDEGIHRLVPEGYWEGLKDEMQQFFKESRYGEGLCLGIRRMGDKLENHFPAERGEPNELPNEVSERD